MRLGAIGAALLEFTERDERGQRRDEERTP